MNAYGLCAHPAHLLVTFTPMADLLERTAELLAQPLPGKDAHRLVMSYVRDDAASVRSSGQVFKEGAVLMLLYPEGTQWHTALILRPTYEGVHSGQVAFPGGRREEEDADLSYTALREAQEEVGIDPEKVQLIGELSEVYIPPSNYIVRPYVGYVDYRPTWKHDPREVAQVLEYDAASFLHERAIAEERIRMSNGAHLKVGAFTEGGQIIWGATAMMLAEFRMMHLRG